jgi:DNA-binding transcriptional LysR family regulator
MLNLKHLYYYHIFAQELSTTKAAKRLGITSPALSNQLKQLEDYLGVALTRRNCGKAVITERGEMVLHYADRMFSAYEELKSRLSASRDLTSTRFRVGICRNLGARFSFDLLSLVEKSNLSLSQSVQITFDSSDRLIEGFMKDQFDLVLGAFAPGLAGESDFISQRLSFSVRLFAPPHLLEGDKAARAALTDLTEIVKLANSKKISMVLPMQPSVLRDETDRFLSASKVQPLKTIECNSTSAIVQLIERGLAMGFVPAPCLLDFKSAHELTVLGPPEGYWIHAISVFIQKSEQKSMTKNTHLAEIFSGASQFN